MPSRTPTRRIAAASVLIVLPVLAVTEPVRSAEKIRVYEFGENDPGAAIGNTAAETLDSQIPPVPGSDLAGGGDLVPLFAEFPEDEPTYVEGRGGPGTFALDFDGIFNRLVSPAFDPRNFNDSFNALSQAWLRPDSAKEGDQQFVWSLGNDNGGVGITADGFWQIIASSSIPDTASTVPVAFDEWSHLALHRTGNNAFLYVNGQLVASGANFWNGVGGVTVGNRTSEEPLTSSAYYDGAIDDFAISGFGFDGVFGINPAEDIDFFADLVITGIPGDVDQDGDADQDDYEIWSENAGFDNGLGNGDPSTLLLGDLDQNGRINFFDFHEIVQAAQEQGNAITTAIPEPSSLLLALFGAVGATLFRLRRSRRFAVGCFGACLFLSTGGESAAEVVVAEDFLYVQPTKAVGPGGGFSLQDYAGGQNGPLGQWSGRWVSVGNGIITSTDHMPEEEQFQAFVDVGLSLAELNRDYQFNGLAADQTLYFGARMRTGDVSQIPDARFNINPTESGAEIGLGFSQGVHAARLGDQIALGFGLVDDAEYHLLVGKLEINAVGENERLTVWLDPTGPEMGPDSAVVENDVVGGTSDFAGNLELFLNVDGGSRVWWDDVAVGTNWEDAAEVDIPRLLMSVNQDTGELRLVNDTGQAVSFNYLEIASPRSPGRGALRPNDWSSLADQGIGDGGWQENSPTTNLLTESNFSGSTTLSDGAFLSLGQAFTPGRPPDLVVRIGDPTGLLSLVPVEFVQGGIEGDYSGNGLVEQADLDLVLGHWGVDAANVAETWINDPPTGVVDQGELDKVLSNWGQSQAALGAVAAVPEPSGLLLFSLAATLVVWTGCRKRWGR